MYDDYEESFFYDKQPEPINKELATQGGMLAGGIVGFILSAVLFVAMRYDVLSSGLLALLAYLLTYKNGWPVAVYIVGAIVIFAVSMILQHVSKIVRLIYGIFVSTVVAILGPMLIGYQSNAELYKIMVICFSASEIWGFISWKVYVKK